MLLNSFSSIDIYPILKLLKQVDQVGILIRHFYKLKRFAPRENLILWRLGRAIVKMDLYWLKLLYIKHCRSSISIWKGKKLSRLSFHRNQINSIFYHIQAF